MHMIPFAALRERFVEDQQAGGATPGLAAALHAIGWGAVQDPSPEELADHLVEMVDACVTGHRDTAQLVSDLAALLRDCGPRLDGGLPPVAAYVPAAEEVMDRYVRGATLVERKTFD